MKQSLRFGTLGSRIYSFFILFIFGTIIILQLVAFQFTISTVRNTTIEANKTLLGQLTRQIESYIEDMEHLSLAVIEADEVQTYLRGEAPAPLPEYTKLIQKQLGTYLKAREDIKNIYFSDMVGNILSADATVDINKWADVLNSHWYTSAAKNPSETILSGSYVQNLISGDYSWVTSISRGIVSLDTGALLGVLLVDLKFDGIKELCQSMVTGRKGYNFIIDDQGVYVFHPTQQLVYSGVKDEPLDEILDSIQSGDDNTYSDGEKYYFINNSETTGWHVVSVLYADDIITDWQYVQISFAAIGLILFLVVGLVTNRITRSITSPVKKLQQIMKSVDEGEFHLVGEIHATDEIKELAHDYDIMVTRIRELMHENVKEQELKRKSDLKALQAQINPHFLYNTLDSIIWMAEMKQHREVVLMTSALSKLMRISISKGREIIPIKDEIAHVESYLTIEEMRYRGKYDSEILIDPELYEEMTLKITLQPLVENAIYHGIKESDHKGLIQIMGTREDDTIVLKVIDNGKGMSPEKVKMLNSPYTVYEDDQPWVNLRGMGVRNVHERIQLYFGEEYGLHCESLLGVGTTITVRIPVRGGSQVKNWFVLLLSFMAALILFFVLTIFYEQSTPKKIELETPIPIVLKSRMVEPMEFWDVVHRGIYEAAKEYGIEVTITGPLYEKEIDQQIEIVEEILDENPPLLILSATDYVKLVATVEKAEKMGIPVITIDSGVDSDIPVSFIATDNIAAGEKAGIELIRLLANKEDPKIAIVSHIKEAASAIDREAGVRRALAGKNIVGTWYCDVEEDRAYEITKELIDTYDLDGIVALNEVASLGVARAVDEYQVKDALVVVAFDNAIRELAFLESGVIKATVVQRPYNMGYMTVKIAVDYLKGNDVPAFLDTESVLITQENMFQREYQELLYPFSNTE